MKRVATLIFAKYPHPGCVKTRMAPPLTPEEAAALHSASLFCLIERVSRLVELNIHLVASPDDRCDDFRRSIGDGVRQIWPQGEGDLGQRLVRATERAFDAGATGVLLLGADSPTLPMSRLKLAADALHNSDAVLGPCDDGGYYLLGLKRPLPKLFDGIDWGGADVTHQTRQRATGAGIALAELPIGYDLDTFSDLPRAAKDLAQSEDRSQPAAGALRKLIETYLERYPDGGTDRP